MFPNTSDLLMQKNANDIQGQNIAIDQSKTFFGGHYHPWRRLFARMIDNIIGLIPFLLMILALNAFMPTQMGRILGVLDNPILAAVVFLLFLMPIEACLLSLFGATLGKWLFGIRITHSNGNLLSFSEALKRSCLVFVQGVGLGIPLIAIFTQIFAYRRLTKTGQTKWDFSINALVHHKKWGVFRWIICTLSVVAALFVLVILNIVGR